MSKTTDSQQIIIKNTSTFSFLTTLSRVVGLSRDLLRSFIFGTGPFAIAFDIAFRIPNMFRNLSAEGAMTQALLPIYEKYKHKKNAFSALKSLSTFMIIILSILSVIAWFLLPKLLPILMNDPDVINQNTLLTIHLSRILFPYLIFISISAIYTTIQYSHNIFWSGAFGPVLVNCIVVILFAAYFFLIRESNAEIVSKDIYTFGYIVLFSSVTQFLFQSWVLKKNQLYFGFSYKITHPIIKSLFVLMLPAIFGTAIQQINLLVDVYLATSLRDEIPGAVAALTYAQRLIQFPMGIFAVAINTAVMPLFSQQFANNLNKDFINSLILSIRLLLFFMLPASIGLFIYSEEIISLIFERGEFNKESTRITAIALKYYALGVSAYGIQKILSSSFYAQHNTKQPALIASFILILNIIFSLSLMPYLKHGGLALGSSMAAYIGVIIYWVLICRKMSIKKIFRGYYKSFIKLIVINIFLCVFLIFTKYFSPLISLNKHALLLIIIILALVWYVFLAFAIKIENIQEMKTIFQQKIKRILS